MSVVASRRSRPSDVIVDVDGCAYVLGQVGATFWLYRSELVSADSGASVMELVPAFGPIHLPLSEDDQGCRYCRAVAEAMAWRNFQLHGRGVK